MSPMLPMPFGQVAVRCIRSTASRHPVELYVQNEISPSSVATTIVLLRTDWKSKLNRSWNHILCTTKSRHSPDSYARSAQPSIELFTRAIDCSCSWYKFALV